LAFATGVAPTQALAFPTAGKVSRETAEGTLTSTILARIKVYIYAFNSEAAFGGDGYPKSIARYLINDMFGYYDGDSCPAGRNRRQVYFPIWEVVNGYVDYSP